MTGPFRCKPKSQTVLVALHLLICCFSVRYRAIAYITASLLAIPSCAVYFTAFTELVLRSVKMVLFICFSEFSKEKQVTYALIKYQTVMFETT